MFFFVAGVQPKTVTLDEQPRLCPTCGLAQARLKRLDHYFSVFFLPLFRVKKGVPFLECDRCGRVFEHFEEVRTGTAQRPPLTCPNCSRPLEPGYRFCPFCGKGL